MRPNLHVHSDAVTWLSISFPSVQSFAHLNPHVSLHLLLLLFSTSPSGQAGVNVPAGVEPLKSRTPRITSIGGTDRMDTVTSRRNLWPAPNSAFNPSPTALSGIWQSALPDKSTADVMDLSCNRSALAEGANCAYMFSNNSILVTEPSPLLQEGRRLPS